MAPKPRSRVISAKVMPEARHEGGTNVASKWHPASVAHKGHYRWVIIGLQFVITTINYVDRNLLGVLKPTIQGDLHFTETDYGNIVFAFSMAYAAGYAGLGASLIKSAYALGSRSP